MIVMVEKMSFNQSKLFDFEYFIEVIILDFQFLQFQIRMSDRILSYEVNYPPPLV